MIIRLYRICVDLLTFGGKIRRISDASRNARLSRSQQSCFAMLLLFGAVAAVAQTRVATATWQSTDEIAQVAEDFLRGRMGHSDQRMTPQAGKLDARLQLPRCSEELEPFLRNGTQLRSRTIVGVRCNGIRPCVLT